jgi:hypothetical protein
MKPTVIGAGNGDDKKPAKPTVIQTAAPVPEIPHNVTMRPTTIPAGEIASSRMVVKPTTISSTTTLKTTNVAPTAIPGARHTRIPVTIEDLRATNPKTNEDVLKRSIQFVFSFDPADLNDTTLVLWGQTIQSQYSQLVSKCLEYSESPMLARTSKHVSRLQDLIGGIHLKELLGFERKSWSDRLISLGHNENPIEEFNRIRTEIAQLIKLMQEDLPVLLALKMDVESLSRKIDDLGNEVEASAIAALFLADYHSREGSEKDRQKREACAELFTQRSMSLTQTLAQIRGNSLMRDMQIRQPLQLIGLVQNVILVMVPGWLGSYASLKSVIESHRKPTLTEIDELDRVQSEIIRQLKEN